MLDRLGDQVCGLGHTRLSIIDLSSGGHQPMASADGRFTVVFNGELYNFRSIRGELEQLGHSFNTTSDTEVLLHALMQWGMDALTRLRGMFAFALWDRTERTLLLARDRLGVKPLYFAPVANGGIVFASEVRTLLASGLVARRLSQPALASYLAFGSVYDPNVIVDGVQSLRAGTWLEVSEGSRRQGTYYELPVEPSVGFSRAETSVLLRDKLREAVSLRLVSDVPVGLFLSAGIDSAVVASLAAQAASTTLHTFTVTFDEGDEDEGHAARKLAERLGTRHSEARLITSEIAAQIDQAVRALDQPSADGINTYFVSRAARQAGLRVALSGIGGDELFAGYASFRRFERAYRMSRALSAVPNSIVAVAATISKAPGVPNGARKLLALVQSGGMATELYTLSRGMFMPGQRSRLVDASATELLDTEICRRVQSALSAGRVDPINAYAALELGHYVRNTLLRDTDVMSMAHGLEVREPLLDHELIDLALRVPGRLKFDGVGNKPLLTAAVPEVPFATRISPKSGFSLPFDRWLRSTLRDWVEATLVSSPPAFLNAAEVRRLWSGFLRGSAEVSWSRIWTLAVLSDYCARHRLEA